MSTEVKVPVLGESITEATLGQWLKKPGEAVAIDEPIASLETDKVAIEVPSPVAGIMGAYAVEEGATVNVGAVIGSIDAGNSASAPAPAPVAAAIAPAITTTAAPMPVAQVENNDLPLSPSVRRLVLELGIDPSKIKGTGKDGRLTKEDVVAAAKGAPTPSADVAALAAPAPAAAHARQEERVKMTRLRQTIAKRLKSAQDTAALLTTFNDVDMSAVMEARATYKDLFEKKHGVRLGFMGFFTKAVALAARDVPSVNAQIDGDEIVYHNYLDVSVAVSAPNGLVVPVIRNADAMSFAQIEKAIGDFGAKAKAGTLTMDDMSGGTFTISNGGVFGSLMSTPIINPPQSAVLGLHRIEDRAVVRNGQVVVRPMMYLALSYDHRLIDGREAVTFLKIVKEAIEDPTRLLIDL
ncbi:MAG: 2-oxoglutarate dehydrogenase complex dihydrolipoyllysine-residue succinyltransferase [Sphingorhabdus sp.]|uniref:2-oxoglutarate dehydrogenase complex dihydrolipoyllysine-residue succinyltransferase n=1 Tax=Sphingorhabdus sp. TaxID=1902408 RepID=UPI00273D08ED|nr:2-oxoglutarate dehydrogenase complex dihydrolipoyllysine-residue succinyltransferase [Sphingorhabdus sp.]MDP4873235.1 2-oxoglutarate dehydrogenase complex dihydrolipoyllysine-residue succinyltransferase [Sphingorhabdus sp.]MDP4927338.1 2-oxoglutarate dehydrogenase complex dihydrolipoyllysine-residue succinyltransferase [Sphingorhabdus sp.]